MGNTRYKFVKLEPGVHAGRHNHKSQNMEEWHYIISGNGWCVTYKEDGSIMDRMRLEAGGFSPRLDSNFPYHEFINDGDGVMLYLAIERYF